MRSGEIRFAVSVDYDDECVFEVVVSQGAIESCTHFYGDADTWKDFGNRLVAFPRDITERVVFETGQRHSNFAYMSLSAYCYDPQGHAAVKVIADNNAADPYRCKLEFSIPSEVASINKIGQFLLNWQIKNYAAIVWQAQTS